MHHSSGDDAPSSAVKLHFWSGVCTDKLGVKKQSISNWENDNIMPSVDMLVKIADFFGVTTDYLLGREIHEQEAPQTLDVTGLTERQIEHIRVLIDDFRDANS